jgi:hypothetical protein
MDDQLFGQTSHRGNAFVAPEFVTVVAAIISTYVMRTGEAAITVICVTFMGKRLGGCLCFPPALSALSATTMSSWSDWDTRHR